MYISAFQFHAELDIVRLYEVFERTTWSDDDSEDGYASDAIPADLRSDSLLESSFR